MREGYIGIKILNLNQNIIPDISSLTDSHAERKNVRANSLALAANGKAAGGGEVVDTVKRGCWM